MRPASKPGGLNLVRLGLSQGSIDRFAHREQTLRHEADSRIVTADHPVPEPSASGRAIRWLMGVTR